MQINIFSFRQAHRNTDCISKMDVASGDVSNAIVKLRDKFNKFGGPRKSKHFMS